MCEAILEYMHTARLNSDPHFKNLLKVYPERYMYIDRYNIYYIILDDQCFGVRGLRVRAACP